MAESDIFANVIGVSNTGLCQLLLEIVLHRDNSFHRGQTTLADNASAGLSILGYGLVNAVILYKIHAAQSDGLANNLEQVLHRFISFTFFARKTSGFGVFYISLSTDLHEDQTAAGGDAAARDRWGE